ncbi:MAG: hypothetical protein ER33_14550 [Cyanobium sp. CACIAM 14]|nr:MAG: hypothetical protein ER33_14550 [Cyanobium sp. CACIAM 14]
MLQHHAFEQGLRPGGRELVVEADAEPVADGAGAAQVAQHLLGDLAVGHHHHLAVHVAEHGVPPAHPDHHPPHALVQFEEIPLAEVVAELQLQAGEQILQRFLGGQADHGGEHRGGGHQTHQVEAGRLAHQHHGGQGAAAEGEQLQEQLGRLPPQPQMGGELQGGPEADEDGRVGEQQLVGETQPQPVGRRQGLEGQGMQQGPGEDGGQR